MCKISVLIDVLAPKVARAAAGVVFGVKDRQHALFFQSKFNLLEWSQIEDTIHIMNIYIIFFIIFYSLFDYYFIIWFRNDIQLTWINCNPGMNEQLQPL